MKNSEIKEVVQELALLDMLRLPHEPKQARVLEIEQILQKEGLVDDEGNFIYIKETHPKYKLVNELMELLEA